jgi:hypothetical protein
MRLFSSITFFTLLSLSAACLPAVEKRDDPQASPRATTLTTLRLQVGGSDDSARIGDVEAGREMVIVERNRDWLRVFANTDVEKPSGEDEPEFGQAEKIPPISGWIRNRGVVTADTPQGDLLIFGEAAALEEEATQPHGRKNAAKEARLLYRRLVELFPDSPLAAEAAWRAADIRWQLERADVFSRPSAKEKENWLRQTIGEAEMKVVEKKYPHTRQADLAAWDRLDNKICGDWQGQPSCPEKESDLFEHYAAGHPDSPKAAEALFNAVYRQAVLFDMYKADDRQKKSESARDHARELAARLKTRYSSSDFTARAATLVYKLEQGIPVYGTGIE